jgi:hypothetical protein
MQHLTMSPPGSQVSFYLKQFVTFGICGKMSRNFGIILIIKGKILRRPWKTVQDFFRKLSVFVAEDCGDGELVHDLAAGDDEPAAAQPGVGT